MEGHDRLARAFVELADAFGPDAIATDFAQQVVDHTVALLPVDAAGILIADGSDDFHFLVSARDGSCKAGPRDTWHIGGPHLDVLHGADAVLIEDLTDGGQRWSDFAKEAAACGYLSLHVLPVRRGDERMGSLSLFRRRTGRIADSDVVVGQALADLAAIGIVNRRNALRSTVLTQQLQTALTSRTAIEQAKGMLAERGQITPDQAFDLLRRYARATNGRLADIAQAVIAGADTSAILHPS